MAILIIIWIAKVTDVVLYVEMRYIVRGVRELEDHKLNLPSSDGIKDGGDGNNSILDGCTVSGVFDCDYKGGV